MAGLHPAGWEWTMNLIFTNDDAGGRRSPESVEHFEKVAGWLESRGLRATWFWIPKAGGRPGDDDPDWVPALRAARERGHDVQLHGLTHGNCLEFGLTQERTRPSNPRPFEEYEANRDYWEREHSTKSLSAKIAEGAAIYERVFAERPVVFRSPCFGMGTTAYEALAANGIRTSSSRGINPTATAYTISGNPALRRWDPDVPCRPYLMPPGVLECPCVEDLTIAGVPADQFDDRLDLFRSELAHIIAEAGDDSILVIGTHFEAMVRTWEPTRELFGRLLDWLPSQGVARCITFRQFVAERAGTAA